MEPESTDVSPLSQIRENLNANSSLPPTILDTDSVFTNEQQTTIVPDFQQRHPQITRTNSTRDAQQFTMISPPVISSPFLTRTQSFLNFLRSSDPILDDVENQLNTIIDEESS